MANEKFLSDIESNDKDVRFAAWRSAGTVDASAIAGLGKLVASNNPGVAKAAREAITTMVHSVGKDPSDPKRASVSRELILLSGPRNPLPVRALAFRLLSNVAGEADVPAIARSLADADAREEVIYCLERIPGTAANKAIAAAYRNAKDDFKPRLLAALGHRRAEEGVPLCREAMQSRDAGLAAAGARAFGRIGKKPSTSFEWPASADPDAMLRYADAQRDQGNHAEAMSIYRTVLARPEEHLQCAAIIGLARMGIPEAASALFPMLKSSNRKVRITAANAWKSMAG